MSARARWCPGLVAALSLGALVPGARAQVSTEWPGGDGPGRPARWSPLWIDADLPRDLPTLPLGYDRRPTDRTLSGAFWTIGNPAGLPLDLGANRSDYSGAMRRERGGYRRPLDAGYRASSRLTASSWARLSSTFGVVGRAALDRETTGPGGQGNQLESYPSSPFVLTDSTTNPSRRLGVRLEAAAGWTVGRWSVGAAVGYDARDYRTTAGGFERRARQAMPGVVLGVGRRVGELALGLQGRFRRRAETMTLFSDFVIGQVRDLRGYQDVQPIPVADGYYRRVVEGASGVGVDMGFPFAGGRAMAFVRWGALSERGTRQQREHPDADRWDARSVTGGGSYQRPLSDRWALTFNARYTRLTGDGDAALDSAAVVFGAVESVLESVGELTWRSATGSWHGRLGIGARSERRVRNDHVALVSSDIRGFEPTVEVAVARSITRRLDVTFGAAWAQRSARASIPDPAGRGPTYLALIAPELDLHTREATVVGARVEARWDAGRGTSIWASWSGQRLAPAGPIYVSGGRVFGDRTSGLFLVGLTVVGVE